MSVYPPAMSALPPSAMVPVRWQPLRVTAAVLAFVALVLTVSSSFLPLYEGELTIEVFDSTETLEVTFTPWAVEYSEAELENTPGNEFPKTGYPIVFGAVALACAAAACWYAATPAAGGTASRVAGTVTAVSSAFLIGTFWTTAIMVSTGVNNIIMLGTANSGLETDATYLAGYWLLLVATVVGFAATILSLVPVRQPAWQPVPPPLPVNPYVSTPPYGVALPMTAQGPFNAGVPVVQPYAQGPAVAPPTAQPLTPEPVSQQDGAVDPLTGQPLATVDPLTGLPLTPGPASPPTGVPTAPDVPAPSGAALDSVTGLPIGQAPVLFTPGPVGPVNGSSTEQPPIELPTAPSPEQPPGPAVSATEDPLAEPPRT